MGFSRLVRVGDGGIRNVYLWKCFITFSFIKESDGNTAIANLMPMHTYSGICVIYNDTLRIFLCVSNLTFIWYDIARTPETSYRQPNWPCSKAL